MLTSHTSSEEEKVLCRGKELFLITSSSPTRVTSTADVSFLSSPLHPVFGSPETLLSFRTNHYARLLFFSNFWHDSRTRRQDKLNRRLHSFYFELKLKRNEIRKARYKKTKGIMQMQFLWGKNNFHKDFVSQSSNSGRVTILRNQLFTPCRDNVTASCHKKTFKHYK